MNNDVAEILDRKLANPETRKAVESLLDNIGTISRSVEWVRTLEETGMGESLHGLTYLVANLRSVLTDDMLKGVSSILNSLLGYYQRYLIRRLLMGWLHFLTAFLLGTSRRNLRFMRHSAC